MSSRALRFATSSLAAGLLGLFALPCSAQGKKKDADSDASAEEVNLDEEGSEDSGDAEVSDGGDGEGEGEDKAESGDEEADASSEGASEGDKSSPVEVDGQTYHFVGLRYRLLLVPEFIMGLFGQGGTTVAVHSFGPEFAIRKDGFEYAFALSYTPYSMENVAFKAPDDPEIAWELVDSELKVLYLTADFMWSTPLSPQLAFIYGGGAGLGLVFGDLYRTQAYPDGGSFSRCPGPPGPMSPPIQVEYCAPDPDHGEDQHYPGYTEPSWTDGGSKPIIFPWLAIQAGLRFKPHRNFVGRLEMGIGLGQVFFGVGADYGL